MTVVSSKDHRLNSRYVPKAVQATSGNKEKLGASQKKERGKGPTVITHHKAPNRQAQRTTLRKKYKSPKRERKKHDEKKEGRPASTQLKQRLTV